MPEARRRGDECALVPPQQANGVITVDVGRDRSIRLYPDFDERTLERLLEVLDRRR
jgi:hypothetical protein